MDLNDPFNSTTFGESGLLELDPLSRIHDFGSSDLDGMIDEILARANEMQQIVGSSGWDGVNWTVNTSGSILHKGDLLGVEDRRIVLASTSWPSGGGGVSFWPRPLPLRPAFGVCVADSQPGADLGFANQGVWPVRVTNHAWRDFYTSELPGWSGANYIWSHAAEFGMPAWLSADRAGCAQTETDGHTVIEQLIGFFQAGPYREDPGTIPVLLMIDVTRWEDFFLWEGKPPGFTTLYLPPCYSDSGDLPTGTVVAIDGGEPPYTTISAARVVAADASDAGLMPAAGIAIAGLGARFQSYSVVKSGFAIIPDLSFVGEDPVEGDELWVSATPGLLTTTRPTGTNFCQSFATVYLVDEVNDVVWYRLVVHGSGTLDREQNAVSIVTSFTGNGNTLQNVGDPGANADAMPRLYADGRYLPRPAGGAADGQVAVARSPLGDGTPGNPPGMVWEDQETNELWTEKDDDIYRNSLVGVGDFSGDSIDGLLHVLPGVDLGENFSFLVDYAVSTEGAGPGVKMFGMGGLPGVGAVAGAIGGGVHLVGGAGGAADSGDDADGGAGGNIILEAGARGLKDGSGDDGVYGSVIVDDLMRLVERATPGADDWPLQYGGVDTCWLYFHEGTQTPHAMDAAGNDYDLAEGSGYWSRAGDGTLFYNGYPVMIGGGPAGAGTRAYFDVFVDPTSGSISYGWRMRCGTPTVDTTGLECSLSGCGGGAGESNDFGADGGPVYISGGAGGAGKGSTNGDGGDGGILHLGGGAYGAKDGSGADGLTGQVYFNTLARAVDMMEIGGSPAGPPERFPAANHWFLWADGDIPMAKYRYDTGPSLYASGRVLEDFHWPVSSDYPDNEHPEAGDHIYHPGGLEIGEAADGTYSAALTVVNADNTVGAAVEFRSNLYNEGTFVFTCDLSGGDGDDMVSGRLTWVAYDDPSNHIIWDFSDGVLMEDGSRVVTFKNYDTIFPNVQSPPVFTVLDADGETLHELTFVEGRLEAYTKTPPP